MARLRAVTDTPLRALGLVRVSKERDGMIAPELQRAAITEYAGRRGYTITEWREGIDESGSRARSAWWPRLNEAVEKVEAGDVDVIIVWKYSRTARHRLRWAVALDRVETAGGFLESATEQIDTTTSTGRFTRGMLAEMAAFEAERIGDTWKETHARRIRQGKPANGKARFGYLYRDGAFTPDPDTGPVLAALYRRYIAGESINSLAAWLNTEGIRTVAGYQKRGGGAWAQISVRRMLDAGFGAGQLLVHGAHLPGAHEPVIDETTWVAYRAARAARRPLKRAERSQYLLSGMLWCACGGRAACGTFGVGKRTMVRCRKSTAPGAPRHPNAYTLIQVVEDQVLEWLRELAAEVEVSADVAAARQARTARRKYDAAALAREAAELDRAMTNLTLDRARRPDLVPEAAYVATRDQLQAEMAKVQGRQLAALAEANAGESAKMARRLLEDWPTIPVEHRRGSLKQLISAVIVIPDSPRPLVRVVPMFPGDTST